MKKSKRIVLHIGCEKTGTTSIQRTFANNRARLLDSGYCYSEVLGENNHFGLPIFCLDDSRVTPLRASRRLNSATAIDGYRRKVAAEFKREVRRYSGKVFIVSSEQLSSTVREKSELLRLRDWLASLFEEIVVVVYVRRQDSMFLSSYSTLLKSGSKHDLDVSKVDLHSYKYNFQKLLDFWGEVFNDMKVGFFDRKSLVNSCVVDDFCCRGDISVSGLEKVNDQNGSLSKKSAEFMKLVNQYLPPIGGERNVRGNLQDLISRVAIDSGRLELSARQRLDILTIFKDSNDYVFEKYLKDEFFVNPFSSDPSESSGGQVSSEVLSVNDMANIFAQIWEMKQEQVLTLIRKNG